MAIKHLYSKIKTAFRFFFRHFYSLNKRLLQLIFRKNRSVSLTVKNQLGDISFKRGGSTISLTISTRNAYLIHINGMRVPVLNDQPVKLNWPVEKGENKFTVCARGIGNKKREVFVVENDQPAIHPFPFKKRLLVKEPNSVTPTMNVRLKGPVIQKTTIPVLKLKLPAIKRTSFLLTQSLEEDFSNFLANNQKQHE